MTKARITRIGTIQEDGTPTGWTFDGSGITPKPSGITVKGKHFIGGYTIKELQEIRQLKHRLESLTKGDLPTVSTPVCPKCFYSLQFKERNDYGEYGENEIWVCTNCLGMWAIERRPHVIEWYKARESHKNQDMGPVRQLLNKIWRSIL